MVAATKKFEADEAAAPVGKRPARMSAGLLTNGRKERRDDERREPHKKRKELWPRYDIANFFSGARADASSSRRETGGVSCEGTLHSLLL
ncbi:hypothetical protein X777_01017 [Ooceraea biroi]|uniref:Uncharacterized protein n=1 Tax=Ooceraea biroi TaxID=2015173 RepID=A0A026WPG6_OOCBI|nr:hypothetical protein X777_01017 [Ooceraea biroi]